MTEFKKALVGAAGFVLLTVAVFSLYISGFAFYHGTGAAKSPRDTLLEALSNPKNPGIVEGILRSSKQDQIISPTAKPCLMYQTQVVKWETFHSDIDDPSSTSETKVFEESGEAFRPYIEHSGNPIYLDVTELDMAYLAEQQRDLPQPPSFMHEERAGFKAGFVAEETILTPDPDAQETHYEVRENVFPSSGQVTAIGQTDADGWLRASQGLSKPVLIPGSREEVLQRIRGQRSHANWVGFKYLTISLLSFFAVWWLWKKN